MKFRLKSILAGLATIAALAVPQSLLAQSNAPIRIIVPFAAGGSSDVMARVLADRMSAKLNQTVLVEPRPGGSGLVASRSVMAAAADGHTLFLTSPTVTIILPKIMKIDFEPLDEFVPVSIIGTNPFLLAVNTKSVPAGTLADFIRIAKERGGHMNYASGGTGTSTHLVAELLFKKAGITMTHVPYRGGAPAVADLLAGHVDAYFGNPIDFAGQTAGGDIKVLATSNPTRMSTNPDIPTVAESIPGFSVVTWNGLVAKKGTPPDVIKRIADAIQAISKEPGYIEQMTKIGFDVLGDSPEDMAKIIAHDRESWSEAVQIANLKPE
jgi:tripartite-type tricarboxylate transporter receptor subunit TctC